MSYTVFTGGKIVTPEKVFSGSVEVKDGKIAGVREGGGISAPGAEVVELGGAYLMPGLIDMHINDGVALLENYTTTEQHVARLEKVSRDLVKRGITGIFPTTLAAPLDEILVYLEGIAQFRRNWDQNPAGTEMCGVLIEGTFMNPANCGAQNPAYMFRPDRKILDRLLAPGVVRLVNIAPEFGDDALDLIGYAVSRGVVPAAGHCKPTANQMVRAIDRGVRYFVHMLNGPTGSSTKSFDGGGTLQAALRDDRLAVELIVDLIHVAPRVVRDVISRKGCERVIGISDSMFPTDAPESDFEISGVLGRVDHELRYIYVTGRRQSDGSIKPVAEPDVKTCDASVLYGAIVNEDEVFENLVKVLSVEMDGDWVRNHPALSLDEAVRQAAQMCCTVPSRVSGMYSGAWGRRVGAIESGFDADLVVAEISGGENAKFTPRTTYVKGIKLAG